MIFWIIVHKTFLGGKQVSGDVGQSVCVQEKTKWLIVDSHVFIGC